tara:strand:+ start:3746 stop:3862 length:117 start_codon:yes stop_codon:yes gene_type:complete
MIVVRLIFRAALGIGIGLAVWWAFSAIVDLSFSPPIQP